MSLHHLRQTLQEVEFVRNSTYFHLSLLETNIPTMTKLPLSFAFITLALLFLGACKSAKTATDTPAASKAFTPSGQWTYEVTELPDGDVSGTMTLTSDGSAYSGNISSDMGETELEDITIEDKKMSCSFSVQGYDADINGNFVGDNFTGTLSVAGYDFPVTMTRKK